MDPVFLDTHASSIGCYDSFPHWIAECFRFTSSCALQPRVDTVAEISKLQAASGQLDKS